MTPEEMQHKLKLYEDALNDICTELWRQCDAEQDQRFVGAAPEEIEAGRIASRKTLISITCGALMCLERGSFRLFPAP
jgi:hypothetical protein